MDLRPYLFRRQLRLHREDPRILGGQLLITGPGTLEEAQLFLLDSIQLTPRAGPCQAEGRIYVEIQGQIRGKVAKHRLFDLADERG